MTTQTANPNYIPGSIGPGNTPYLSDSTPTPPSSSIDVTGLQTPQTPVNVTPPANTTNYAGLVAGGNATLAGNAGFLTPTAPTQDAQPTDLTSLMASIGSAPPSAAGQYNADYAASGIDQKQGDFNAKQQALLGAQGRLSAATAKIQGLNAEAQAIPIQAQQDAEGRGITAAGLAPITAGQLRMNALKALPLQAEALAAQAEVASAQGNAQLSQSILQQAQDHLDKVYQIHVSDAQAQYNYQKDARAQIYQFATAQEKAKLDAQQRADDQTFQIRRDAVNNAQSIAKAALDGGQADLAAKITALDPKSPNYQQNLATLEAQIKPDVLKQLQVQQAQANLTKTRQDIANNAVPLDGTQGATSISNDVQAILEGRNTMYNIRQTMGRTNKAAQYMQQVRDQITKTDPNFDFVASDAGGKSVSTAYVQRATGAINAVMPNIDKIVSLSDQVNRLGVKGVDSLLQKTATQFGDQKVSNFHQAQKLIADEIGVALGAGTVSDMKLQLGFDVTDTSVTPEVFASNMNLVKEFLLNRKAGLQSLRYSSPTANGVAGSSGGGAAQAGDTHTYNGTTYVVKNGQWVPQ